MQANLFDELDAFSEQFIEELKSLLAEEDASPRAITLPRRNP